MVTLVALDGGVKRLPLTHRRGTKRRVPRVPTACPLAAGPHHRRNRAQDRADAKRRTSARARAVRERTRAPACCLRLILILTCVLLITVPAVLRISSTPVTLMSLLLSLRATCLPVVVSLSLTFAVVPGGMFETPEASRILLGARVELSSLRRRAPRGTNAIRSIALLQGVPRSGERLQVTGTGHREPVQGMGVCGVAGPASGGGGGGGGGGGRGQFPETHCRERLYCSVFLLSRSFTRMV